MDLMQASNQWSTRPADECFYSIKQLDAAAKGYRLAAGTAAIPLAGLRAADTPNGDLILAGREGATATLTNWSFGQLATVAKAPPSYLQSLPAPLAAECLNHGFKRAAKEAREDKNAVILFAKQDNDRLLARAINSERYGRIWNADVTQWLSELEAEGNWHPAPAAYDGKRGLYLSDRDMFAFLVDNERRIFETAPGGGMSRGFFAINSEVGAASFKILAFLYNYICGNHIVWGAEVLGEINIRHIGDNAEKRAFDGMRLHIRDYANKSRQDDENRLRAAQAFQLGKNKEETVDFLATKLGRKIPLLSGKLLGRAYDAAEQHVDWYGAPNTAYGMAQGVTHIAREIPHNDARNALDTAGGKIMAVAF